MTMFTTDSWNSYKFNDWPCWGGQSQYQDNSGWQCDYLFIYGGEFRYSCWVKRVKGKWWLRTVHILFFLNCTWLPENLLLALYIYSRVSQHQVTAVLDCEFWIIITRLKHIFINQTRNHYNQHIFANKKYACLFP